MDLSNIWKNRDEEIIQDCLDEAYSKMGYRVTNYHRIDRRHEKGIDLSCENPDEKIHIQTKKKPLKADIKQLKELSKSKANKKIYVYVEMPVVAFKKEMEKTKNVDFWDNEKLHDFLIENKSTKYLRILFLSSNLVRRIVDILEKIAYADKTKPKPLENDQVGWWWVFKDRAVKLHGSLELLRDWYQAEFLKKDKMEKEDIEKYLKNIFAFFNLIDQNSAYGLSIVTDQIKRLYPQLLSEYAKITEGRSNWLKMPYISRVKACYIRELIENWVIPEEETIASFYSQINFYIKNLMEIADAIEDGVDWVAEDKFGHEVVK